jgi:hypothetical protein
MEMTKSVGRYDDKERRKVRRNNKYAKDLHTEKYRMRRVESKKDKGEKYPLRGDAFDEE